MKHNHQAHFPALSLNGLGGVVILWLLEENSGRLYGVSGYVPQVPQSIINVLYCGKTMMVSC